MLIASIESKILSLVKLLCENFELELKEAFKFCEGLKVSKHQYEGKIIYPNMAKEFIAYLDTQGFFTNQKCFILTDNIKNKDRLLYLSAVLNSKTNFWYFKQIGATLGASGYEMSKIFVEKLPVVETNKIDSTLLKEIESLASEILESKRQKTQELEQRLDSLIYQLYDLNQDEINIIESELQKQRERIEVIDKIYQLFAAFLDSQHSTQFEAKIIWAEMTQSPCFIYEDKGYYINQTCYFIPRDDVYLCAVLNSKLIYFYMKQIASNLGDGAFRWIKQYIEKLPIPKIDSKNQTIVNQIIALVDEILKLKAKDSAFDTNKLESEIDSLVYKLYNLTNEEIEIAKGC